MEGITILNQTEITEMPSWVFVLGAILLILALLAALIATITNGTHDIISLITGIICAILVVGVIITSIVVTEEPTGQYKYEVTIDYNVSMMEVYKKYEVIDQRGDIWVLKDKR